MLQIRIIEDIETLHPTFLEWWKGHGWDGVPASVLPKLGAMCVDDEQPVAAAWLYMDNTTGVCMLEWIVTDPKASPLVSAKALGHIVTFLKARGKDLGYGIMLATCRQKSLSRLLTRQGFQVTDESVIHHLTIL